MYGMRVKAYKSPLRRCFLLRETLDSLERFKGFLERFSGLRFIALVKKLHHAINGLPLDPLEYRTHVLAVVLPDGSSRSKARPDPVLKVLA